MQKARRDSRTCPRVDYYHSAKLPLPRYSMGLQTKNVVRKQRLDTPKVERQQQNRRKESLIKKAYEDQSAFLYWLLISAHCQPAGGQPAGDRSLAICQKLRPTKCMRVFEPMTLRPHICGALSG
jgi:hypothetical protein